MKIEAAARRVWVFPNLESLSEEAAREIVLIARESIAARGRFSIALSGGSTPKRTHQLLADRHRGEIDWSKTDVVFGDERFVPHTDPRSNYKMARETLLDPAGVGPERVHPVPTDAPTPADAANRYERTLRDVFSASGAWPLIDLVLLGMGPDGHTASLFPASPALGERNRWAVDVDAPTTVQPAVPRITLTLPVLDSARNVLFLVAGQDKRPVLVDILKGAASAARYPAAMVAPSESVWLVEQIALPA